MNIWYRPDSCVALPQDSHPPVCIGQLPNQPTSPPLESCIFGHIPVSRRWDTVRYSGIQLDTARYIRIQLDTVGYSWIQLICGKMARYG